jgi:hypothetical protein
MQICKISEIGQKYLKNAVARRKSAKTMEYCATMESCSDKFHVDTPSVV